MFCLESKILRFTSRPSSTPDLVVQYFMYVPRPEQTVS